VAGPTENFVHAISKAGLVGMARTLALELAPENVRVNCLCPGYIDTPRLRAQNEATNGRIDSSISKATPLGRMGTVRECASAILYFASNDATYCTGSTLVNDGGCAAQACWGTKE
jgi:NAD(P)-dependent dehydrogenase (short-subunit alcohol dehydrogenase family)